MFRIIDEIDLGLETADAVKSENDITDKRKVNAIIDFVNKQKDRILLNKMNS